MNRILMASLLCVLASTNVLAQLPADDSHLFDFLLGTWNVKVTSKAKGIPPTFAGRWTGMHMADDRIIADEYRILDDSGATVYLVMTYRAYDRKAGRWMMRSVEPGGAQWSELSGWRDGDGIRVDQKSADGKNLLKIRYSDISADHFHWQADHSDDGGKTWVRQYIIIEATRPTSP